VIRNPKIRHTPAARKSGRAEGLSKRPGIGGELGRLEYFARSVMDNLPIGIAVNSVDPDVTFEYMNDNFPRIYRTTREALSAPDSFWEAVYEDPVFREEIRRRVLEDTASGDPARMHWDDVPVTRKGQLTFYVSAMNIPLRDKHLMISTVQDVTERKRGEEALRVALERLRRFVDANLVGVAIADASGAILEANDYYLRVIGFGREELERGEVNWRVITPPEWLPADERAIAELRARGTCTPYEKEYLKRDGSRTWVFMSSALLPGPGEQIAAFILDITKRKRAENELARKMAELERFQALTVDRELKMISLKKEVNELLKQAGMPEKYRIVE
jgi:PAS domain S-box-containing protein